MDKRTTFEFGFMNRREKIKLVVLKLIFLAWTAICLLSMVFWDQKTSVQLETAGASLAGPFFYMNFCNVKSEVMELFEPPYPLKGGGLAIVSAMFLVTSIYLQWIGD